MNLISEKGRALMSRKKVCFKLFRITGDLVFINLSFILAFYLRFLELPAHNLAPYISQLPYISIFSFFLLHLYNLYGNQLKKSYDEIFYAFIPSSCIIVLFSVAISYFLQTYSFPRSVFLLVLPIMIPLMIIWRYFSLKVEEKFSVPEDIVIVGEGREALKMVKNIKQETNSGYNLRAVLTRKKLLIRDDDYDIKLVNGFENLEKTLCELDPELVFVSGRLDEGIKKELFYHSLERDWEVSLVPDFYEIMLAGAQMEQLGEMPVYEMKRLDSNQASLRKRIFDVVISLSGLIITLPLTVLAAILIMFESRGSVFFTQERISRFGERFKVYKFRTMVQDAEKETGPVMAGKNDCRITKIGKILRKTRIDEIPQLYNVLKGDMSLIGPRPERPHFVEQFENEIQDYKYRHRIKCGITGLAQIFGYYSTDPEDKLRLDLLYANKASFVFDLKIILHTIKVMLMGRKAS